ncbi:hypothetical protein D3C84_1276480 [compost metagenome]
MDALGRSPHCQGHNDRGWRADLDFLLQPSRYVRLIEGAYENGKGASSQGHRQPTQSGGGYLDLIGREAA